jgi:hypothetical protein
MRAPRVAGERQLWIAGIRYPQLSFEMVGGNIEKFVHVIKRHPGTNDVHVVRGERAVMPKESRQVKFVEINDPCSAQCPVLPHQEEPQDGEKNDKNNDRVFHVPPGPVGFGGFHITKYTIGMDEKSLKKVVAKILGQIKDLNYSFERSGGKQDLTVSVLFSLNKEDAEQVHERLRNGFNFYAFGWNMGPLLSREGDECRIDFKKV